MLTTVHALIRLESLGSFDALFFLHGLHSLLVAFSNESVAGVGSRFRGKWVACERRSRERLITSGSLTSRGAELIGESFI